MYDYRGIDGTGTASKPASGSNAVSYTVRKLADGNCWMGDSLKLALSTSTPIEVANFDGTVQVAKWTPNSTTTANAFNYAIIPATRTYNGYYYYPWYAATAGQGTYNYTGEATQSICPKGWRLPPASTVSLSLQYLIASYGINTSNYSVSKLTSLPLTFIASGLYSGSASGNPAYYPNEGYYVTSTASGSNKNYYIRFYFIQNTYLAIPDEGNNKYYSMLVRCVAIP